MWGALLPISRVAGAMHGCFSSLASATRSLRPPTMGIKGCRGIFLSQLGDQHEANAAGAVNDRLTRGGGMTRLARGLAPKPVAPGHALGPPRARALSYGAIDLMPRARARSGAEFSQATLISPPHLRRAGVPSGIATQAEARAQPATGPTPWPR
jgi:hypothetical protein